MGNLHWHHGNATKNTMCYQNFSGREITNEYSTFEA